MGQSNNRVVQFISMVRQQHSDKYNASCDGNCNGPEEALASARIANVCCVHTKEASHEGATGVQ